MHVVSLGSAPLGQLIPLHEGAGEWVVLFELEVARGLVIAEGARHGQILRASIKDDTRWLTHRRAHVYGPHVHCIVPARQRHLQLQIVLVVLGGVGNLGHQLFLLEGRLCLRFRLRIRLRRDALVQIYFRG